MKIKRNVLGALLVSAAVLGLLPAGCRNPASSSTPEPSSGATGRIRVSIGLEGAPAPAINSDTFSTYTLSFVKDGGGTVPDAHLTPSTISQAVELPVGTYTVTVTAYKTVSGTETAIAQGAAAGVAVADGGETPVTLTLGPTAGGAQGALSYAITVPAETAGTLAITTATGGTVSGIGEAALAAGTENSGTKNLDPGYYRVQIALTRNGKSAGHTETAHIYTGLTSTLTKSFGDGDFEAEDTPPGATGSLGVTVGFNYGDLTLATGSGPYTLAQDGGPNSLTLTAPAGYTNIAWYLDGKTTAESTAPSITLEVSALEAKPHSITFIGYKDGRPYSQAVPFTVQGIRAEDLASYLAGLSDNTKGSPHKVVFDSSINVSGDEWGGAVKSALAACTKYLKLDLSACQVTANTISGSNSPSGNNFNVIKSDKIVGIILPSGLTTIGAYAFSGGWIEFKNITIPDSVTTIGERAFFDCKDRTITIPASVTKIEGYAFSSYWLQGVTLQGTGTLAAKAFYGSGSNGSVELVSVTFVGDWTIENNDTFIRGASLRSVYDGPGTYVRSDWTSSTWTKKQ